jgi:pseudouridine synthase
VARHTRLNKLLAERGVAARRKCDLLIQQGRVRVDGEVARDPWRPVDGLRQRVLVDGRPLAPPAGLVYLAWHKPTGVVTTMADPRGRPSVRDFLPRRGARLFPVGRLDFDTSGLLVLTNDGRLAHRLAHPRYHVPKTYRVRLAAVPPPAALRRLERGFEFAPGETSRPARVESVRPEGGGAVLTLTIREGRYRQVRRMCEALALPLTGLQRVRFGPVRLGALSPGRLRRLTRAEVAALRRAVEEGAPHRAADVGRRRRARPRARPRRRSLP